MNVTSFFKAYWAFFLTPAAAFLGWHLDNMLVQKYSTFRHKSKLLEGDYEAKMKSAEMKKEGDL